MGRPPPQIFGGPSPQVSAPDQREEKEEEDDEKDDENYEKQSFQFGVSRPTCGRWEEITSQVGGWIFVVILQEGVCHGKAGQ